MDFRLERVPARALEDQGRHSSSRACAVKRRAGSSRGRRPDGSIDADAFVRFVDEARQLCRKADRLAACDEALGRIMAYAPADADGVWPFEPARNVLDRGKLEHMRRGFLVGTMNKRGMSSRAYDEGGDHIQQLRHRGKAFLPARGKTMGKVRIPFETSDVSTVSKNRARGAGPWGSWTGKSRS